ncbi:MAG: hypothetical protein D6731_03310, partial [Planctomycetota bacterium]
AAPATEPFSLALCEEELLCLVRRAGALARFEGRSQVDGLDLLGALLGYQALLRHRVRPRRSLRALARALRATRRAGCAVAPEVARALRRALDSAAEEGAQVADSVRLLRALASCSPETARALRSAGLEPPLAAQERGRRAAPRGPSLHLPRQPLRFSTEAQRAYWRADRYARCWAQACLRSEHLLLGLVEARRARAARTLDAQGVDLELLEGCSFLAAGALRAHGLAAL